MCSYCVYVTYMFVVKMLNRIVAVQECDAIPHMRDLIEIQLLGTYK